MTTLVLLPGLDGTGSLFAPLITALSEDIEVIVVSYPRDIVLDYAELEGIVRSHLPTDRPYYLLAESFSGPIGISLAAARPPGLAGLILCASFARTPLPWLAALRPLFPLVPVKAIPTRLLAFFVLGRFSSPARCRELTAAVAELPARVLRGRAISALTVEVTTLLTELKTPLLYLRASEDRIVPASAAGIIQAAAPHTRIVDLPAPHFLLQVQPEAAAAAIRNFMEVGQR
jgi:pimeloyl-ACP methyl ester carboxylesterase